MLKPAGHLARTEPPQMEVSGSQQNVPTCLGELLAKLERRLHVKLPVTEALKLSPSRQARNRSALAGQWQNVNVN